MASKGEYILFVIGTLRVKIPPYFFSTMRRSKTTTMPLSSARLTSRPKPCLNFITACGRLSCIKGFPPFFSSASLLAEKTGSFGTANGSFTIITWLRLLPGTSTPSQKLSVANKTLFVSFLNFSRIFTQKPFSVICRRRFLRLSPYDSTKSVI